MSNQESAATVRVPMYLVCHGTRIGKSNKRITKFTVEEPDHDLHGASICIKYDKTYAAGYVYKGDVTVDEGEIVALGKLAPIFSRKHEDALTMQMESRANELSLSKDKKAAKIQKEMPELADTMRPLRDLYCTTNAEGKAAIEVMLLKFLKTGSF